MKYPSKTITIMRITPGGWFSNVYNFFYMCCRYVIVGGVFPRRQIFTIRGNTKNITEVSLFCSRQAKEFQLFSG